MAKRAGRAAPTGDVPGFRQVRGLVESRDHLGIEWTDERSKPPMALVIDLEWEVIGGRAEPIKVVITSRDKDRALTSEIVRRVPIGGIVTDARAERLRKWEAEAAIHYPSETDEMRENIATLTGQYRRDAQLSEVANVYRAAFASSDPRGVQRAVAEHFGLSLSGAAKKIAAARSRGYLGAARGTRPGERQPEGDAK